MATVVKNHVPSIYEHLKSIAGGPSCNMLHRVVLADDITQVGWKHERISSQYGLECLNLIDATLNLCRFMDSQTQRDLIWQATIDRMRSLHVQYSQW